VHHQNGCPVIVRRAEDATLMMLTELTLILIYMCVMLVKVCNESKDICARYGFGDSALGEDVAPCTQDHASMARGASGA
jgi:hypothetical protein